MVVVPELLCEEDLCRKCIFVESGMDEKYEEALVYTLLLFVAIYMMTLLAWYSRVIICCGQQDSGQSVKMEALELEKMDAPPPSYKEVIQMEAAPILPSSF